MSTAVQDRNLSNSALNSNILHQAPTTLQEPWRFTPVKKIEDFFNKEIKFNNGNLDQVFSLPNEFNSKISLETAILEPLTAAIDQSNQIVRDHLGQCAILKVDANAEFDSPLVIKRDFVGGFNISRLRIEVGRSTQIKIIFDNQGVVDLAEEIEIICHANSNLHFISLQDWADGARHLGRIHTQVEKDANFTSEVLSIGGSLVRLLPTVEFTGPHSSATMNGLYFAADGNHSEHRVLVNHNVPDAKSRVLYKGALSGANSHTVWFGDVFIEKAAVNTDTYELNRNLVLTQGARADSVPNLEIETGQIVGAGHASTTGKFDDDQLFYLMSRGIDKATARKLVVRGYFAEIVEKLGIENLQERITGRLEKELEKVNQ